MSRKYCKAYLLQDIRQFHGWAEKSVAQEPALSDHDIVYVWDDFTVVKSPVFQDAGLIFDAVTPEWQAFCTETLQFEVPADIRSAYEQPQEADSAFGQQETRETTGAEHPSVSA